MRKAKTSHSPREGFSIKTTDKAILWNFNPDENVEASYWVPKSVIDDDPDDIDEHTTEISIADWWLQKEGL